MSGEVKLGYVTWY